MFSVPLTLVGTYWYTTSLQHCLSYWVNKVYPLFVDGHYSVFGLATAVPFCWGIHSKTLNGYPNSGTEPSFLYTVSPVHTYKSAL